MEEQDLEYYALNDLSGNNKNAKVFGATLNETEDGLVFDGDDYVLIPSDISSSYLNTETVEIEFSTLTRGNQVIYSCASNQNFGIGTWDGYLIVSSQARYNTFDIPSSWNDGNKHKLSVTYNNGTFVAYFDGQLMTKRSNTNRWGVNSYNVIGRNLENAYYFKGVIYSLKEYNRVLSEEEINGTASSNGLLLSLDASNYSKTIENSSFINNNQGVANTTASSYMTFDMTEVASYKTIYVNAEVSSQSGSDIGYIHVYLSFVNFNFL